MLGLEKLHPDVLRHEHYKYKHEESVGEDRHRVYMEEQHNF